MSLGMPTFMLVQIAHSWHSITLCPKLRRKQGGGEEAGKLQKGKGGREVRSLNVFKYFQK